jgi:predicted nucleic acid-binding protein
LGKASGGGVRQGLAEKMKMRVYLDNCCFNRPFDDQTQPRIKTESEAKLYIQNRILLGDFELVWSYILDVENNRNPDEEVRRAINDWKSIAVTFCVENDRIIEYAENLRTLGIKSRDALHVACAVYSESDCFLTTDRRLSNKRVKEIPILNPLDFIELEE